MDFSEWSAIAAAVLIGNGLSFFFFFAAMKCSRLQKNGVPDDKLPAWVYLGLIAAPSFAAYGISLTTVN